MVAAVVMWPIGAVILALGYLLWKKEKISLLHSYHREKVTPENKKAFCAFSGAGVMLIGLGIVISGTAMAARETLWGFLPFGIGFAAGLGLLVWAGLRYNR